MLLVIKESSSNSTHLKSRRDFSGFTIVELIIATTVFSTVLMASLFGFFHIGRLYYKGVTITQTQQSSRAVLNQVLTDIQQAADGSVSFRSELDSVKDEQDNTYQRFYYCVGSSRYTVLAGRAVNLAQDPNYVNNFGILKDPLPGGGSCTSPYKGTGDTEPQFSEGVTELLADNMRVSRFSIEPIDYDERLFNVRVRLAYGNDDVLDLSQLENIKCDDSIKVSEFCSVAELDTNVTRGLIKL